MTVTLICCLSCVIRLCQWTVSNVHWRLFCTVCRLGFLVATGACVTTFVNCAFFEMSVYYYYYYYTKLLLHSEVLLNVNDDNDVVVVVRRSPRTWPPLCYLFSSSHHCILHILCLYLTSAFFANCSRLGHLTQKWGAEPKTELNEATATHLQIHNQYSVRLK